MSNFGYHNYNQGSNQGYNPNQNQGEAASYYNSTGGPGGLPPFGQEQQQFRPPGPGQFQDGPTGERGVLGAIGGGLAGGAGGHAIGNKTGKHGTATTIIGAIAGAVAGHKLQDGVSDWKDKRDEEKEAEKRKEEEEKRRSEDDERRKREDEDRRKNQQNNNNNNHHQTQHQQPQPQSRDSGSCGAKMAGNFSGSCKDISLDHAGGEYLLRAQCRGRDGCYRSSSIALNNIVSNDRGCFRWAAASAGHASSNGCGSGRPAEYTVVANDTLRNIGAKFGIEWQEIAKHNCIQNPDLIYPGQTLKIPGGGHQNGGGGVAAGNFGASARNVRLEDCGKKLVADLKRDGQWVCATLVLDERIGNDNGSLVYVKA
ncbi:CVNH domain-containing protein [Rhypophila decipiens]|uniref:CVNH domain-containing protein n=1 Tax=Rhypophila decipiens TaxID=261697 RepID=A0AAN6Y0K9_9PEZI|nr:CVNH domain-containing protein [Rhypophila decipiens]